MKLTDRILQAYLQDHFSIISSQLILGDRMLQGPLFYQEGMMPESGWVYVTDRPDLCSNLILPEDAPLFVVSGNPSFTIPENLPMILLEGGHSVPEVMNVLIRGFRYYSDWDQQMSRICDQMGTVEDILKVSVEVMKNPLLILRSDFTVLAAAGNEGLPEAYRVLKAGVENMDIVNAMLQDQEYQRYRNSLECYWGPDYILGFRSLNWNLIRGTTASHCLMVLEYRTVLQDYMKDLLEILGRRVKQVLAGNSGQTASRNDSLHRIFYRILSDRTLDYVEASRMLSDLGWHKEEEYLCLVFQQTYVNQTSLPPSAIANHMEEQFEYTVSFPFEDKIVSFFNLTRLGIDKDEVGAGLSHFIRDAYLKAGYSRVMDGHMNLRRQYIQSTLALEVGGRKQPYLWIHHFDQIAMSYMMEQITRRLPGNMLCHTGILRLRKMDEENGSEYIRTLRTFLDEHQNVVHSANDLFIHRSTLIYRLDKIREILDSDLEDPEELLYIELSLRLLEREKTLQ